MGRLKGRKCSPVHRPIIGLCGQYVMQFDRDVVAGFITYATTQTDWHVSVSSLGTSLPLRQDCAGYLVRGGAATAELPPAVLARAVLVSGVDTPPCPRAWVDDDALGRLAANHLLRLSPRTLVSVTSTITRTLAARHVAFVREVRARGRNPLTVDLNRHASMPFREEVERGEIIAGLERMPLPLAIACSDPTLAFRTMEALHERGLSIPAEAAIMACEEDAVIATACRPPLTTIDCAGRRVGYAAAALLHRLLAGDTTVGPSTPQIVAPGNVIRRASTEVERANTPAARVALAFMRQNMRKRMSVADIARHIGVPRRTMERLFRQEIGCAPAAELLSMRLDRARELLVQTPSTVTEIAAQCGFGSLGNFVARFRDRHRCTPTEFRLGRFLAGGPRNLSGA